jgi:tetratricopeptide (TPR) repeat protein
MTHAHDSTDRPAGPSLADLFAQYLRQQTVAAAQGLGYAEPTEQVEPYDTVPVQPVDPRLAWEDALAAAAFWPPAPKFTVPPEWPSLVAAQEPAVAVAFCLGNYPQVVRNLHPLLSADPAALRTVPVAPVTMPTLTEWARQTRTALQALLAAGVLRLAGHFDQAQELLSAAEVNAPWKALRDNEQAALAWHRGQTEEALRSWQTQEASVPVQFNRGMALLFLGHPTEAQAALTAAVHQLPETSAWHHLGQLYLALAANRQ